MVIVDRITKTVADEEIISRMYGLQEDQSIAYDGAEEVIFTSYKNGQRVDIPDLTLDELKPGDIIQIQPDGDSRIEWVIRFNNSEEDLFSDTVYFERNRDLYMIRPATSTSIPGPSNTYFICGRVELMQIKL